MSSFIADEDITAKVVTALNDSGLTTQHVKYDYDKGGAEDPIVLSLGKKKKSTVITNNTKDYTQLGFTELRSSPGVWCMQTPSPNEQLKRIKGIYKKLPTKKSREGKLVLAGSESFKMIDYKNNKTVTRVDYEE